MAEEGKEGKEDQLTPERLLRVLKRNVGLKLSAGETAGLAVEIERIRAIEKDMQGAQSSPEDPEGLGVPDRLRVKRAYTLSPAAIEARQKAASCSKPGNRRSQRGNKNAWKHGRFATGEIRSRIKPCLKSCAQYDSCELVKGGKTKAGGLCPENASDVLMKFLAVQKAIDTGDTSDFKELAAFLLSLEMNVLHMLLNDVTEEGTSLFREKYDKDGRVFGREVVPHPSLLALRDMINALKITPDELMVSPKALSRKQDDEDGLRSAADIFSRLAQFVKRPDDSDG